MRFKAEIIRDFILSSSGLLNPEIGGPSVKPYQPKGVWENSTSGRGVLASYTQDHGDNLYIRGLYTFIKLTAPPPSMMIFDASNRDQCEAKRSNTNTPLQALTMLNDPTVLEASRVLAEKITLSSEKLSDKIEKKMVKVMKKGSRIMVTGYNEKGSQTIDHYSLLGFTKAYNTAKKACS